MPVGRFGPEVGSEGRCADRLAKACLVIEPDKSEDDLLVMKLLGIRTHLWLLAQIRQSGRKLHEYLTKDVERLSREINIGQQIP